MFLNTDALGANTDALCAGTVLKKDARCREEDLKQQGSHIRFASAVEESFDGQRKGEKERSQLCEPLREKNIRLRGELLISKQPLLRRDNSDTSCRCFYLLPFTARDYNRLVDR